MELVIQDQILDEAVGIFLHVNTSEKGMNPSFNLALGKQYDRLRSLDLVKQPVQK